MEQSKRLYRSRYDSVIAGVAGGIARHFNIDPIIIRVLFVVLAFAGAGGIIVYIILWIAVPLDPDLTYYKFNKRYGFNHPADEPQDIKADEFVNQDEEAKGKPEEKPFSYDEKRTHRSDGNMIAGIILIVLGGLFLFVRLIPDISFGQLWPVVLIIAGIFIMRSALSKPKTY